MRSVRLVLTLSVPRIVMLLLILSVGTWNVILALGEVVSLSKFSC